jgi:hypothetical protein
MQDTTGQSKLLRLPFLTPTFDSWRYALEMIPSVTVKIRIDALAITYQWLGSKAYVQRSCFHHIGS